MDRAERLAQAAQVRKRLSKVSRSGCERARCLLAAEAAAIRLTSEAARELLGRWAARTGHTSEEVERLNGQNQMPV